MVEGAISFFVMVVIKFIKVLYLYKISTGRFVKSNTNEIDQVMITTTVAALAVLVLLPVVVVAISAVLPALVTVVVVTIPS